MFVFPVYVWAKKSFPQVGVVHGTSGSAREWFLQITHGNTANIWNEHQYPQTLLPYPTKLIGSGIWLFAPEYNKERQAEPEASTEEISKKRKKGKKSRGRIANLAQKPLDLLVYLLQLYASECGLLLLIELIYELVTFTVGHFR